MKSFYGYFLRRKTNKAQATANAFNRTQETWKSLNNVRIIHHLQFPLVGFYRNEFLTKWLKTAMLWRYADRPVKLKYSYKRLISYTLMLLEHSIHSRSLVERFTEIVNKRMIEFQPKTFLCCILRHIKKKRKFTWLLGKLEYNEYLLTLYLALSHCYIQFYSNKLSNKQLVHRIHILFYFLIKIHFFLQFLSLKFK